MDKAAILILLGCASLSCGGGASSATGDGGLPDSGATDSGDAESRRADSGSSGGGSPALVLVAAGGAGSTQPTVGFSYDVVADAWSQGTPLGTSTSGGIDGIDGAVSVAFIDATHALTVLTNATDPSGVSGPVQFATWVSGAWTPFSAVGSAGVTASSPPSLVAGTSSPELAFAGDNTNIESSATFSGATWSAVSPLGTLTGGPPSIAARGADATVAYVRSSDGALVAVDRTAGVWGSEEVIESGSGAAPPTSSFAPSLVAPGGTGPDLVVVYTDVSKVDLHFATRSGAQWSPVASFGLPSKVINPDPVSPGTDSPSPSFATPILALAGGGAMIAFTSASQHVYTSQFDGTNWSTATSVFTPWCLDCLDAAQVGLASGVGSATVEVVFGGDPSSQNDYVPYHTRLVAGQWTAPKPIVATLPGLFATYAMASHSGGPL